MQKTGFASLPLHPGKDGFPFPVERKAMGESTESLKQAVEQSKLPDFEKKNILKKLAFRA